MHFLSTVCVIATVGITCPFVNASNLRSTRRQLKDAPDSCTLDLMVKMEIPGEDLDGPDYEFGCEFQGSPGDITPLNLEKSQMDDLMSRIESGKLVSGESIINLTSGTKISDDAVHIPAGTKISLDKRPASRGRRLADVTGEKPILVVKVTDSGGLARGESAAEISADVFGSNSDHTDLVSSCSAPPSFMLWGLDRFLPIPSSRSILRVKWLLARSMS